MSVAQSRPTFYNPIDCSSPGPLSMESSRQEYWSGLPFPSPEYIVYKYKISYFSVYTHQYVPVALCLCKRLECPRIPTKLSVDTPVPLGILHVYRSLAVVTQLNLGILIILYILFYANVNQSIPYEF